MSTPVMEYRQPERRPLSTPARMLVGAVIGADITFVAVLILLFTVGPHAGESFLDLLAVLLFPIPRLMLRLTGAAFENATFIAGLCQFSFYGLVIGIGKTPRTSAILGLAVLAIHALAIVANFTLRYLSFL